MIVCGKQCTHQQDGYCVLEDITSLTNAVGQEQCGYFAPASFAPGGFVETPGKFPEAEAF